MKSSTHKSSNMQAYKKTLFKFMMELKNQKLLIRMKFLTKQASSTLCKNRVPLEDECDVVDIGSIMDFVTFVESKRPLLKSTGKGKAG